jgi:hypothetical protein
LPAIEEITLGAVDEEDQTFCLTFGGNLGNLERSIAAVGQTSPLHVRAMDGERYQLVTGFRRVRVLRQLGRTRVLAAVHPMEKLPDPKAARLAVFDNLGVREYNLVEKAKAVELLLTVGRMSESEVVQNVLHPLGLQAHGQVLERLRRLLVLEEGQLQTIAEEGWPARAVLPICAWRADARRVFFEIVEALRPGANKLTELATWLEEIALRDDRPITAVIVDLRLRTMSQDSSLAPQERLRVVREAVRRARFPTLAQMTRQTAELVGKLQLEPFVSVRPPEGFEGDTFEARFDFSSPEELRTVGRLLSEASNHPAAEELRDLLTEGPPEEEVQKP